VSEQYALFSLAGPHSAELIEASTGRPMTINAPYEISERQLGEVPVIVTEHRRCGVPGYDLFVPTDFAARVRDDLLSSGKDYGARQAGEAAFEIARIEAGVPREGVDAGENYIILESELNEAVSYTKGCYLGQEVIARIHWRGQPAKRLRGLVIDADHAPLPGTQLFASDGKKAGEVTSSTRSIALDAFIALAYVHRYYLTPGTEFTLATGEEQAGRARLVELPFFAS
jgi:folate-binding protein YgfZ